MCGIAGTYELDRRAADVGAVRAMTAQLVHRGPDGEGHWVAAHVALGHRRLSIIDLELSSQPMHDASGHLHLTFNGEVFNYRDLRRVTPGYPFRTNGDTETILARWAKAGPQCVRDLVGQFAFALFNDASDEMYLVRDRLGVLPLYYCVIDRTLYFASEVKALIAALGAPPALDTHSVAEYLSARAVHAPYTLFEGIRKVPPGHYVRVADGRVQDPTRYWDVPSDMEPTSDEQAVRLIEDRLLNAVDRSLVADVPVGAYLSGGLDSSLTTAMVRRLRPHALLSTYAAGFGDARNDELPFARQVADHLRTDHHEVHVRPDDFATLWGRLSWFRDAPVSEASDVAVYLLAKRAREDVKVVLSGEGSDELFAGYPKHQFAVLDRAVGAVPFALRGAVGRLVEERLPASTARARIAVRALSARTVRDRHLTWFAPFSEAERRELLGRQYTRACIVDQVELGGSSLTDMLRLDLAGWLPDNLLERGDRMSMANSLELRPPFLDRDLVEAAMRMPNRFKRRQGNGKWVIRQVATKYLPPSIIDRKKVGFRVPLDRWFQVALRDFASDRLLDRSALASRLFDRDRLERMVSRHMSGTQDNSQQIWTLLCLEIWHSTFYHSGETVPFAP